MGLLDFAAESLAEDEIDGVVQAGIMVFSYLDSDGEEKLCIEVSDATISTRLGLIEYLHERHIWELKGIFEEASGDG